MQWQHLQVNQEIIENTRNHEPPTIENFEGRKS